jgi:asparagine synthase (glutamine-hydrolysing)
VLERRAADEPLRFDRAVVVSAHSKSLEVASESFFRLGHEADVRVAMPLLAPRFLAALARAGGANGWVDRSATVRALAGAALPDALHNRRDKARFSGRFFAGPTRTFAREWSGAGVDDTLVDPEALRHEWLSEEPDFRSAMLLQVAWLHEQRTSRQAVAVAARGKRCSGSTLPEASSA